LEPQAPGIHINKEPPRRRLRGSYDMRRTVLQLPPCCSNPRRGADRRQDQLVEPAHGRHRRWQGALQLAVSTARRGYRTPTGTFKPTALVRYHSSTLMPHSIFFLRGYAIHGSYEIKHLGRPASHGCIRLHPKNAAALYSLVQRRGSGNTLIKSPIEP
jgi:hypothetical protein